jgi:hypothetical protein
LSGLFGFSICHAILVEDQDGIGVVGMEKEPKIQMYLLGHLSVEYGRLEILNVYHVEPLLMFMSRTWPKTSTNGRNVTEGLEGAV